METKLTREYAEKLAFEIYPIENYSLGDGKSGNVYDENQSKRNAAIDFYLKAIEETNAKGLLEALVELKKDILADNYDYRLATMRKVDEAIKKASI